VNLALIRDAADASAALMNAASTVAGEWLAVTAEQPAAPSPLTDALDALALAAQRAAAIAAELTGQLDPEQAANLANMIGAPK
jgi:hypothetical protein